MVTIFLKYWVNFRGYDRVSFILSLPTFYGELGTVIETCMDEAFPFVL